MPALLVRFRRFGWSKGKKGKGIAAAYRTSHEVELTDSSLVPTASLAGTRYLYQPASNHNDNVALLGALHPSPP
jgi:hypothetical protein